MPLFLLYRGGKSYFFDLFDYPGEVDPYYLNMFDAKKIWTKLDLSPFIYTFLFCNNNKGKDIVYFYFFRYKNIIKKTHKCNITTEYIPPNHISKCFCNKQITKKLYLKVVHV